jgi:hypothetical protein
MLKRCLKIGYCLLIKGPPKGLNSHGSPLLKPGDYILQLQVCSNARGKSASDASRVSDFKVLETQKLQ